jgi:glycosyltransferase involved in cell wall biosynthesis
MNPLPIVSVVISTYNRQEKLERAIHSVLTQSFKEIEVIIVDNASTDNTTLKVANFKDERIVYIRHEANKGGPAARNTGIKAARAPFIAFLDDDDQWDPSKLEKQVQKMNESSSKVGLVYVGTEVFDESKNSLIQTYKPNYRGNVSQVLLSGTILGSVSSVLVRKECFDQVGMFDESLSSCQDWDMWLRIAQNYEFEFVDEILARINMHGEQISTDYTKLIPGRTRMVQKHEEKFKKSPSIYVIHLKRIGKLHFLNGSWTKGLPWFTKALKVNPLEIFKILAWILIEWPWVRYFSPVKNFKRGSNKQGDNS